jgi:hypothetical protein
MMSEIYQRGPITCSIACPDDLTYDYRGGVYIDHSNSTREDIDHDIEVRSYCTNLHGLLFVGVSDASWDAECFVLFAAMSYDGCPASQSQLGSCTPHLCLPFTHSFSSPLSLYIYISLSLPLCLSLSLVCALLAPLSCTLSLENYTICLAVIDVRQCRTLSLVTDGLSSCGDKSGH